MSRPIRRALLAGAALLVSQAALARAALAQPAPAPPPAARDRVWPQSYSDLPADPAVRFGVLPNGLRYAIMRNDTPKGQTALRLRIGSGSLEETPDEQGVAHMLEHMAFKGSTHAPNGEQVRMLERLGLHFGGDTNASTGWTETIYQLDLPESDKTTLDTGLTFFSDIGSGLLLKPEALATERGVVLSEERLRDTPDYEVEKARLEFQLHGQLAADRFPIGKLEVIRTAPAALLRRFYEANYQPDRAVLVAVGDFDPDAMQADIARLFGGWRPAAPQTPAPDLGAPTARGPAVQLTVREGAAPSLSLAWLTPHDNAPDSVAKQRRDFIEQLALSALNRRFQRVADAPDPPFLGAQAGRQDVLRSARAAEIEVTFRPERWRQGLDAAVAMQRQALQYGFSQAEVLREVTETGLTFRNAAASAATRRTPALADELVRTVDDQEVDTSPAEDLKLYTRFTDGLTAAEVDAALRRAFEGSGPLVSLATPDPVDGGEGALAAAVRSAETAPIAPPASLQALAWRHTDFGPAGRVVETRPVPDLGVTFVRFANGVRLTVKPTAFHKDQVLVAVDFGHGRLELPRDRIVPDWAAPAFVAGGLTDLTYQDVQQVLADRTVSAAFGVGDDAWSLSGTTRPQDLDTQMQLLAAYMTVPGWRPEAFARTQALFEVDLAQLASTPQGVEARDLPGLEHGGDARWLYPTAEQARAARLDQLQALIAPALAHGPVEVTVAGDTTVKAAIAAVARTFGALPTRGDLPEPPGADQVRFPAGSEAPVERTHQGRADQAIAREAWAVPDLLSDLQRTRRINVAGEVLQLRLTDRVRIAEGASYSPAAGASESEVFPGYGDISAAVETPPAKIAGFYADVSAITADLRTHPVTADELQRAVKPRIATIEKAQQTNAYWITMLHGAEADPRRLDLIRTSITGYEKMTPEDVRRAAADYLTDRAAWRFEVAPATMVALPIPVPKSPEPSSSACPEDQDLLRFKRLRRGSATRPDARSSGQVR